ncbi:MAG: YitT family protein [Prolixibacteraceae bacterium]|nr:YitT family protein [Prolixibacteraceae bacterium]MBN2649250.1 YitT family protein [Prolixibacteraceae bacterium]
MKLPVNKIKAYGIMFLGSLLFALGWTVFLIPADINGGGISGVGALLYYVTGIPAGVTYLAVNTILVTIAIIKLGANFGAKTIVNMLLISVLLTIFQKVFTTPIINDKFLSAVLGGISGGLGLGLVFSQGGSTGGTDIIAMLVTRYRRISPGRVIMYCDVIIISASWFIFHSAEILVYGYVSMWVVSYTLDAFLNGANQSAQIFIFSEKWEEIQNNILHHNRRGVTLIDGIGAYTQKPIKIIMTVVRKRETSAIFRDIKKIDNNAFITMGSVMGVYGEGFDALKA